MPDTLIKAKINLDTTKIRSHFPILHRQINGHPLIYLDNAATTQKPKAVTDKLLDFYQVYNSNIHRGVHTLSQEATDQYEAVREIVAKFIGASKTAEVIFTRNTTESLNLVAFSWAKKNLIVGDEILLTEMEHHSNLVPWQRIAKENRAVIKFLPINLDGRLLLSSLKGLVTSRTRIVSLTHASNVLGTVNDIKRITAEVKKINSETIVVVDGAQASGHLPVDVRDLGVDFYAFSAHKMLGPTGVGVLWGREALLEKMDPFLSGGDMVKEVTYKEATWNELPHKFEAGTPNIADVIAFGEAVNYLHRLGMNNLELAEMELTKYALDKLSQIPQIRIYGPKDVTDRLGVISFNIGKIHAHDLATVLDGEGICIRSGHHCAQPLMSRLQVGSTARVSTYLYNTKEEIDKLVTAILKAQKLIHD